MAEAWRQLRLDAATKCLIDARTDLFYAEADRETRGHYIPHILHDITRLKAMVREHTMSNS